MATPWDRCYVDSHLTEEKTEAEVKHINERSHIPDLYLVFPLIWAINLKMFHPTKASWMFYDTVNMDWEVTKSLFCSGRARLTYAAGVSGPGTAISDSGKVWWHSRAAVLSAVNAWHRRPNSVTPPPQPMASKKGGVRKKSTMLIQHLCSSPIGLNWSHELSWKGCWEIESSHMPRKWKIKLDLGNVQLWLSHVPQTLKPLFSNDFCLTNLRCGIVFFPFSWVSSSFSLPIQLTVEQCRG